MTGLHDYDSRILDNFLLQLDLNNEFEGQMQAPLSNQNRWERALNKHCILIETNDPSFNIRCMGGRFWCIKDVCGMFCVFFTWLLILYAEYVLLHWSHNQHLILCFLRFVVLRVILYSHPNKVFSVINGLIFQVMMKQII